MDASFGGRVRIGKWPVSVDIDHGTSPFNTMMVGAQVFDTVDNGTLARIELRRHNEDRHYISLFLFEFEDGELPEYWEDSELLWKWERELSRGG